MPTSSMLTLATALRDKLEAEIPALVTEINAAQYPEYPITVPTQTLLGVRTEMIKRNLEDLPALACAIYTRVQDDDPRFDMSDGQQEFSRVLMPYLIDIYLGDADADALYIKAHKWALVFDLFVERHGSSLVFGYLMDEAPSLEISYVLELRDGTFRQLVSATGVLVGVE